MSELIAISGKLRVESPPPGWSLRVRAFRHSVRRAVFDDLMAFMRNHPGYTPRGKDVCARWPDIPRASAYSVLRRARAALVCEQDHSHAAR